jgi:hypothetical protein
MICNSSNFEVLLLKDRFTRENHTSSGWADALLNGRFIGLTHVVEIQLHHDKLVSIREDMGGHHLYSIFRSLVEALEVTFGKDKTEKLMAKYAPKSGEVATIEKLKTIVYTLTVFTLVFIAVAFCASCYHQHAKDCTPCDYSQYARDVACQETHVKETHVKEAHVIFSFSMFIIASTQVFLGTFLLFAISSDSRCKSWGYGRIASGYLLGIAVVYDGLMLDLGLVSVVLFVASMLFIMRI